VTNAELAGFVRKEARLLDERRWDEWLSLFAEDGFYWVPLSHGQTDPLMHNSLAYEDQLLLRLRIERLREGPFSQHPPSRSQHVLQDTDVEPMQDGLYVTRTAFLYAEVHGDAQQLHAGTAFHHLRATEDGLRIVLKRVNLLGCEQALPSLQLFP
jgi:3-phenylpropionate/cinnamic acid dioxygenase small subunit